MTSDICNKVMLEVQLAKKRLEMVKSNQLTEEQINTSLSRERQILIDTADFTKGAFEIGAQIGRDALAKKG